MKNIVSEKKLRSIFMGTPELAVPTLQELARVTDCVRVITQPDRPAGRGKKMRASAVKAAAEELSIPVWQPQTLRGAEAAEELQGADIFVVMAYGEILRQAVLDIPAAGCINVHCSLLPRWRGASPLQAALRAGDTETGVAIMRMVRALDAGPVYLQESFPLDSQSTLESVHERMAGCAAAALTTYFQQYPNISCVEQNQSLVSVCGKLTSDDGHLDFSLSMSAIDAWIRAYTPAPGCWILADGERLRILRVRPAPQQTVAVRSVLCEHGSVYIGCADGAIEIMRVQAAGKRAMDIGAFLNGRSFPQLIA